MDQVAAVEKRVAESMVDFERRLTQLDATSSPNPTKEALCRDFAQFKVHILDLLRVIKTQLNDHENRIDALENRSKRKQLLLHGVPETVKENCQNAALDVIKNNIGLKDFSLPNIDYCFRLGKKSPSKSDRYRPLLIHFSTTADREAVWSSKKTLKGSKIMLTESLTKTRLDLLKKARSIFTPNNVWTRSGDIKILLPDSSISTIATPKQLDDTILRFKERELRPRPPKNTSKTKQ